MPSIKDAIEKNRQMQAQQASQVTGSTPLPTPAHLVVAAPPQDVPLGGGLPQRGMFPANMVLSGDRNDSSRMFRGPGTRSATFPFPVSQGAVKLTVTNTTVNSGTAAAAAVEFLTNNIPNPVQNVLNLLQGSGINITVDQYGNVLITNTQPQAAGANAIQLIDNFCWGTNVINSSSVGELKWFLPSVGAANSAYNGTGAFPNLGTFNIPNDTNASDYTYIVYPAVSEGGNATDALWPLFDYPAWTMTMIFQVTRYPDSAAASSFPLAQTSLYLGVMGPSTSSNSVLRRPAAGAWLRFDTDPTAPAISDSTFWFECVSNDITSGSVTNVQGPVGSVFDTTIVPAEFVWYTLTMSCSTAGSIDFSLEGSDGSAAAATLVVPTFTVSAGGFGTAAQHSAVADVSYGGILTPFGVGSLVSFAGTPNVSGTHALVFSANAGGGKTHSYFLGSVSPGSGLGVLATGFPAVVPWYSFGNDTQSTPTQNKQLCIDFFEFVWNPTS